MIRHLNNCSGVTLFLVLWVMVILSVIGGTFCRAMRTEVNIARNDKEATQAYYSAIGGFNLAISKIIDHIARPEPPRPAADGNEDSNADWRINAELPPIRVGEGIARVRIDNEGGKVNINLADQTLLGLMLTGLDLTEDQKKIVVSSILDWRDTDDLHRLNGAENDYYQSLLQPYACKNGDFDTVEELLLVRGITPEIFHERLKKIVTVIPNRKTAQDTMNWMPNQTSSLNQKKSRRSAFSFNKINVNAAPPELLLALPGFSPESVDAIRSFRAEKDIRNAGELAALVGPAAYAASFNTITFSLSPYYHVSSYGRTGENNGYNGVSAVVYIDLQAEEPYRILQWIDYADPTLLK